MVARGAGESQQAGVFGKMLALYVYEYLLHVGAQKSAQTFLSEIRWEKNITLGEPPGFLHSWWWYVPSAAAPNSVMGAMAPNDAMGAGPMAPGFFQPPVGLPGSQPLIPGAMDPSPRTQGHPSLGGPMQRVTPPRGMASVGPQGYGAGMRPPPNSLATSQILPSMNMDPQEEAEPPEHPSCPALENMYTIMNPIGPGAGRANVSGGRCASPDGDPAGGGRPEPHAALCPQFPLGPGPEGPMASMSAMEPHHVNGSL
ncbi:hypothetical protein A6R68_06755, partial [Neotoma lepida]